MAKRQRTPVDELRACREFYTPLANGENPTQCFLVPADLMERVIAALTPTKPRPKLGQHFERLNG